MECYSVNNNILFKQQLNIKLLYFNKTEILAYGNSLAMTNHGLAQTFIWRAKDMDFKEVLQGLQETSRFDKPAISCSFLSKDSLNNVRNNMLTFQQNHCNIRHLVCQLWTICMAHKGQHTTPLSLVSWNACSLTVMY